MESSSSSTRRAAADAALLEAVFAAVPEAILVIDGDGTIRLANRQAHELFAYAPEALVGRSVDTLVPAALAARHALHRAAYQRDLRLRPMGEGLELCGRRADGADFPIDVALGPVTVDGELLVVAIVRDVTARKLRHDELRYLSEHDALTGLLNRRGLDRQLAQALAQARRHAVPTALMLLDLDGFKLVNDRFGHLEGDRLLRDVVQALRERLRAGDTIARLGGDEFAITAPFATPAAAEAIGSELCGVVRTTARAATRGEIDVTASVGVAALGLAAQHATAASRRRRTFATHVPRSRLRSPCRRRHDAAARLLVRRAHTSPAAGNYAADCGTTRLAGPRGGRSFDRMFADDFLPAYDVHDAVGVVVNAGPDETWDALMDVDLIAVGRRKPLVGILGGIRMLPELAAHLLHGELPPAAPKRMRLCDTTDVPASDGGWVLLGERPGEAIALGLVGKFWRPVIAYREVDRERFRDFAEPGYAKTVYELSVRALDEGRTLLTGAMRTATTDGHARNWFRRYWTFGVGSGAHVLVNGVLEQAREAAERHAALRARQPRSTA